MTLATPTVGAKADEAAHPVPAGDAAILWDIKVHGTPRKKGKREDRVQEREKAENCERSC
jgi:hypothetical protein